MCIQYRVPIVITSLAARTDINDAVHSYGGLVLHDVTTDAFARKAIDKGADGLIAVAAGAGGHAGTVSPFALIQEIRQWFGGPLVLSGAIAHGRSIVAAEALGADLAYIGSAFLATHEAHADASYKQMIVNSKSADIVYTDVFTGVPCQLPARQHPCRRLGFRGSDAIGEVVDGLRIRGRCAPQDLGSQQRIYRLLDACV